MSGSSRILRGGAETCERRRQEKTTRKERRALKRSEGRVEPIRTLLCWRRLWIVDQRSAMRDVLMLLLIAAFFVLCIAYVWWCDRIIGPDPADARNDVGMNVFGSEHVSEVPDPVNT
jgi:hypothetical protein